MKRDTIKWKRRKRKERRKVKRRLEEKVKESERDWRSEFMLQARGSCCESEILLPVRAQLPGSHT